MEISFTSLTLLMIYLHKLAISLNLSEPILELCDPIYYQPLFNSPHLMTSVSDIWGKGWQRFFQRTFIFGGGKPLIWLTKQMGMSSKVQRVVGLFGIFAASAVIHIYSSVTPLHLSEPSH